MSAAIHPLSIRTVTAAGTGTVRRRFRCSMPRPGSHPSVVRKFPRQLSHRRQPPLMALATAVGFQPAAILLLELRRKQHLGHPRGRQKSIGD